MQNQINGLKMFHRVVAIISITVCVTAIIGLIYLDRDIPIEGPKWYTGIENEIIYNTYIHNEGHLSYLEDLNYSALGPVGQYRIYYENDDGKYILGRVYFPQTSNMTSNITILLFFPTENEIRLQSWNDAENLSGTQFEIDKVIFEPDTKYIITLFNERFNSSPVSISYKKYIGPTY